MPRDRMQAFVDASLNSGERTNIVLRLGRALTEEQRARWIQLLLQCADEIGIPNDLLLLALSWLDVRTERARHLSVCVDVSRFLG